MPLADELMGSLVAVLDRLVPRSADGQMPGAGELGLAQVLSEKFEQDPTLGGVIRLGIEELEKVAKRNGHDGFASLSEDEQTAAIEELAGTQPAFIPSVVFHTYTGYYQHPRVLLGLGLEARPPYPKGYELEQVDLSLLDPVRAKGSLYREV